MPIKMQVKGGKKDAHYGVLEVLVQVTRMLGQPGETS
jgi:hypothetical protein